VKVQFCIDSLAVEPYSDMSESNQTLIYYLFKIYLNTVFLSLRTSCSGCTPSLTSCSCALALLSPHPVIVSPPLHCCFGCALHCEQSDGLCTASLLFCSCSYWIVLYL